MCYVYWLSWTDAAVSQITRSVFIGCGDDDKEHNLAFGKICIYFLWFYYLLNIPSSLFRLHEMVPK
jgi:hypothetical protein